MNNPLTKVASAISAGINSVFQKEPTGTVAVKIDQKLIDTAKVHVLHVDGRNEPWEWKHRQAIRAMINRFPEHKIRDLNLAIEIAVQQCSASA